MIRGVLLCGIGNVLFQIANMLHAARRLGAKTEFGYVDLQFPANRLPHKHGTLYKKIFSPWGGHAPSRWRMDEFFHKLAFSDILFAESVENYCRIISTSNQSFMIRMPIQEILDKLPADRFLQIHRRFIVRKDLIQQVNLKSGVIVVNKHELPVSKSHKAKVRELLGRDDD